MKQYINFQKEYKDKTYSYEEMKGEPGCYVWKDYVEEINKYNQRQRFQRFLVNSRNEVVMYMDSDFIIIKDDSGWLGKQFLKYNDRYELKLGC